MKRLEDIPLAYRIALTFAIVVIILILFAAFGYFLGRWDDAGAVVLDEPPVSKYEDHLLALDREALDKAYKDHIGLVFGVWMKGPTDPDSPRRAGAGARNARQGYEISMERLERRERRIKGEKP